MTTKTQLDPRGFKYQVQHHKQPIKGRFVLTSLSLFMMSSDETHENDGRRGPRGLYNYELAHNEMTTDWIVTQLRVEQRARLTCATNKLHKKGKGNKRALARNKRRARRHVQNLRYNLAMLDLAQQTMAEGWQRTRTRTGTHHTYIIDLIPLDSEDFIPVTSTDITWLTMQEKEITGVVGHLRRYSELDRRRQKVVIDTWRMRQRGTRNNPRRTDRETWHGIIWALAIKERVYLEGGKHRGPWDSNSERWYTSDSELASGENTPSGTSTQSFAASMEFYQENIHTDDEEAANDQIEEIQLGPLDDNYIRDEAKTPLIREGQEAIRFSQEREYDPNEERMYLLPVIDSEVQEKIMQQVERLHGKFTIEEPIDGTTREYLEFHHQWVLTMLQAYDALCKWHKNEPRESNLYHRCLASIPCTHCGILGHTMDTCRYDTLEGTFTSHLSRRRTALILQDTAAFPWRILINREGERSDPETDT